MKNTIFTLDSIAALAVSTNAQSFTDWANSGWTGGDLTGSANWNGYGTVSATITSDGGNFLSVTGTAYPRIGNSQGNVELFGSELTDAKALTWLTLHDKKSAHYQVQFDH